MCTAPGVCVKCTLNKDIESLKMVQNQAVRMISLFKGRRGVTEAKEKLQLIPLEEEKVTGSNYLSNTLTRRGSPSPLSLI